MDQPASFSSLPPELVAKICSDSNLDKEDLISLRLTSKTQGIHASATKTFAKCYFTDVLLLYNEYSLETSVKICQHPLFGPSVRRVQLSCVRYDRKNFFEGVQVLLDRGRQDTTRRKFMRDIQMLNERCEQEKSDPDHVIALLGRAFDHLAKSNNNLVLAVSADEETSLGRSKGLEPELGYPGWSADPHSALNILLLAADKSYLGVRKIEINVEADPYPECVFFDMYSWLLCDWRELKCVALLSELTVDVWSDPVWPVQYENFGVLQCLLRLATRLKRLHIRSNVFVQIETEFRPLARLISRLPLGELHLTDLELIESS